MKNPAYKKWLMINSVGKDMAIMIMLDLMEQNQMTFELMEEAEAEFNMRGYEKAAKLVKEQVQKQLTS